MTLACSAPRCRAFGRHLEACATDDCKGCQPRLAADGLRLCEVHVRRLGEHAHQAADVYTELALALLTSGRPDERTSGSKERGAVLNERAVQARTTIRHTLVSWCRLVSEERGITLPNDDITSLASYVAKHAQWLGAHPAAGECSDELEELARGKPWRIAYPTGARVVEVGACPLDGCGGTVRAILRRTDSLLPSELVCDTDGSHRWSAEKWRAFARTAHPDAAHPRSYTAAEIAREHGLPLGTVYWLAKQHGWRRSNDGRRPVLYVAADVEATLRVRAA